MAGGQFENDFIRPGFTPLVGAVKSCRCCLRQRRNREGNRPGNGVNLIKLSYVLFSMYLFPVM
jgi:hypothetical protein